MDKLLKLKRRKLRIRKKIKGTNEIPRMTIYKSLKAIYVQLIDDSAGSTLCSSFIKSKNKESAKKLGEVIAKKAKETKINKVVFDRNGLSYHGVVEEFANSARANGLEF